MARYSAKLTKRGFGALTADLPVDIVLTPESWAGNDRGGHAQATVTASGSAEGLAYLCGWLGDTLTIYNEYGDLCWSGILWDLEVSLGNVVVTLSMDNIYNRVKVIYPHIRTDGSEESASTAWTEDTNSIDHYGTRELLYGMPDSFTDSAVAVRDQLLAKLSAPGPVVYSQAGRDFSARLSGRGLWQKAAALYFTNLDGLVEHSGESGTQSIGHYITSNLISFGTLTPGGDADEMFISAGNFDPLTTGDTFTISGAAVGANNDTYTIDGQDATNQITISGSFAAEAAGATIKFSMGDAVSMDNIAQSFTTTTPRHTELGLSGSTWTCTRIALKARRVGKTNPSDAFRVGIYADSGGVSGANLANTEIPGVNLYTEFTWVEFVLPIPLVLTAGTTYWFQARRTGAANLSNGYEIAVDEDLGYTGGSMLLWNGSAWVTRIPNADMPFRIIGEINSTAQLTKAINAVGDFNQAVVPVDSLIPVRQYTDGDHTVMEEMDELLDAGTSTGQRLIATIAADNSVVVDVAPLSSNTNLILGNDGKIRYPSGGEYVPGRLVYGQFVDVDSLLLLDAVGLRANRGAAVYIASSEFDAHSNRLTVSGEGALDPFTALQTRRG